MLECIASHASMTEQEASNIQPLNPAGLGKKISMAMLKGHVEPTVVYRAQYKTNRPLVVSLEKGDCDPAIIEIIPDVSPSTSGGDSNSTGRKSSAPGPGQSTGKTSLDSKWSPKCIGISHSAHSTENKKSSGKTVGDLNTNENILTSIAETESYRAESPSPSKFPSFAKC